MGQAKLRGDKEQRIAQAMTRAEATKKEVEEINASVQQALREIPKVGTYVSAVNPTLRFIVGDVWISQPEDEEYLEGFFLIEMTEANEIGDMSAIGYELDPQEWRNFVEEHQLFFSAPLDKSEFD